VQKIENGVIDPDDLFHADISLNQNKAAHHHHHEDHDLASVATWSFSSKKPLDGKRMLEWVSMLYSLRPFAMLRLKGILQLSHSEQPLLLQAVGSIVSPLEELDAWPGGLKETNLVLIFRDIPSEDIAKSFEQHVLK